MPTTPDTGAQIAELRQKIQQLEQGTNHTTEHTPEQGQQKNIEGHTAITEREKKEIHDAVAQQLTPEMMRRTGVTSEILEGVLKEFETVTAITESETGERKVKLTVNRKVFLEGMKVYIENEEGFGIKATTTKLDEKTMITTMQSGVKMLAEYSGLSYTSVPKSEANIVLTPLMLGNPTDDARRLAGEHVAGHSNALLTTHFSLQQENEKTLDKTEINLGGKEGFIYQLENTEDVSTVKDDLPGLKDPTTREVIERGIGEKYLIHTVRQTTAHETGHLLGLAHSTKADREAPNSRDLGLQNQNNIMDISSTTRIFRPHEGQKPDYVVEGFDICMTSNQGTPEEKGMIRLVRELVRENKL